MKSSFFRAVLCSLVLAAIAGPALAQDPFDAHVADIRILEPKPVQKDIGITDKQHTTLMKYAKKQADEVESYLQDQKGRGKDPNRIAPDDPHIVAAYKELQGNVFKTLTPGQLRRLREITLQARGYAELLDPMVEKRLAITPKQLEKIRDCLKNFAEFAQGATRDAYMAISPQYKDVKPKDQNDAMRLQQEVGMKIRQIAGPKIQQAHQKMDKEVEGILTREQEANWISLLGKSFKKPS